VGDSLIDPSFFGETATLQGDYLAMSMSGIAH